MNKEILQDIGLTKSEINVYLALLDLGSSTTGKIVDKSKTSSSKIYEVLDRLTQKGLVSFIIKSGVKHFEPAPPERILDYMEEKENKFNNQKSELKKLIPELELKRKLSKFKSEATIFKGIKGAKTAYDDVLKTMKKGEEYYVLGATGYKGAFFNFINHYHKIRSKKGIKVKILYSPEGESWAQQLRLIPHTEVRLAPGQILPSSFILMYKDKTLVVVVTDSDITLFRIESKEVADSFKSQFELLWSQEVTVTNGIKGVQGAWNKMLDELNSGDEYYVMGASWRGQKKEVYDYFINFHKERQKRGIRSKFLFTSGTEKLVEKHKDSYKVLAEVKFLPQAIYEGIQFNLYKNKVLIFVWREKEPVVFTIEDKQVYQTFKTYFDTLWNQETRVVKGLDAVQDLFEQELESGHCDLIGARGYFVDARPKFIDDWEKRCIKQGYTSRNIVDVGTKGHRLTKWPFMKTKYTISKEFSELSVIWIFGNKVVITNWTEKEPIALIIENQHLHDLYQKQFDTLWNQDVDSYKGPEGVKLAFENLVDELQPGGVVNIMGVHKFGSEFKKLALYFQKIRSKKSIKANFLMNSDAKSLAKEFSKYPPLEIKFMKKGVVTPAVFLIYNDKVLINLGDEMTFFVIKNKQTADAFNVYFNQMWKIAE